MSVADTQSVSNGVNQVKGGDVFNKEMTRAYEMSIVQDIQSDTAKEQKREKKLEERIKG